MTDKPHRFILYCEDLDGALEVQKELNSIEGIVVELAHTPLGVAEALVKGPASCIIINSKVFDTNSSKMIQTWRRVHPQLTAMVVTKSVVKEVFGYKKRQKKVVIFENPADFGDFRKLCRKVVEGQEVYQRRHERFSTEQPVLIENMLSSKKCEGTMKNMSRGGALLEMDFLPSDGDVLKVIVNLKKVGKQHTIYGEVVRINVDAYGKNKHGIGIFYISPEDLYDALLHI